MGAEWSQRTYKLGDEQNIFSLVKAVWGEQVPDRERWLKGWQWMFVNNPAGGSIIWLAEHNDKLVGEYPLVLVDMKIGGKVAKAAQIADTMTHPEYRRQGIASSLGKQALRQLKTQGGALAFGFPTAEAYPLHIKSSWFDVCPVKTVVRPLNLRNLVKGRLVQNRLLSSSLSTIGGLAIKAISRLRKPPEVDGLTITRLSSFDHRFDDFWQQVCDDYNIIVVRSKDYLNWRYVDSPNVEYTVYAAEKEGKVCGYIVLGHKYYHGLVLGHVVDIIAPLNQHDIIQNLISKAVAHFALEKADAVVSSIIANKYYTDFLKVGFISYPRSRQRFIAYNASPHLQDEFLRNPKNWFIQSGDLPLVY